jgi:LPXTG-motif cell wall-anchored protein
MKGSAHVRRRWAGLAAGLAASLLAVSATTGTAQAGVGFTFTIDPTSGPPETVIEVTATCLPTEPAPDSLRIDFNTTGGTILNTSVVAVTPDVEVMATIAVPPGTEPGTYRVLARCFAGQQAVSNGEPVDFTVTEPGATTSTTSTTSPSTSTTTTLAPATTVTTVAPVPTAPVGGLPPTGQRESNTALLAAGLVVLGTAAVLLSRRRSIT